jgi:3-hydroxyisobutyrate dehydrogenase-like beta-hydroxyacid dehydrogenase
MKIEMKEEPFKRRPFGRREESSMSKAAFIGLGAMGSRMAANLLKAGHEVAVCDLVPEAVEKVADSGAKTAASAREAAETST